MPDAASLVKLIKKTAVDAVEASKPVKICYGKVSSTSPLKIVVDQKMTLSTKQLVLTEKVTDYKTNVTVSWTTGTTESHAHSVSGKKSITIHNGLAAGDKVVLLRMQGGQKYIVLDRVDT